MQLPRERVTDAACPNDAVVKDAQPERVDACVQLLQLDCANRNAPLAAPTTRSSTILTELQFSVRQGERHSARIRRTQGGGLLAQRRDVGGDWDSCSCS